MPFPQQNLGSTNALSNFKNRPGTNVSQFVKVISVQALINYHVCKFAVVPDTELSPATGSSGGTFDHRPR